MKAVLEFEYPKDEDKLRLALHGGEMYTALIAIRGTLQAPYTKAEAVRRISVIVEEVLAVAGG